MWASYKYYFPTPYFIVDGSDTPLKALLSAKQHSGRKDQGRWGLPSAMLARHLVARAHLSLPPPLKWVPRLVALLPQRGGTDSMRTPPYTEGLTPHVLHLQENSRIQKFTAVRDFRAHSTKLSGFTWKLSRKKDRVSAFGTSRSSASTGKDALRFS